jgi:hypothetical protein
MKPPAEMHEGPEAYQRFKSVMKAVLAVPHSVIQRRIEEPRRRAAKNPNKRGRKRRSWGLRANKEHEPAPNCSTQIR